MTLLQVEGLKTYFQTDRGRVTAVDGISFQIEEGEILGVVGESGCGKSVTSQSILRLYDEKYEAQYDGSIFYKSKNLLDFSKAEMEKIRGNEISMVFQDPLSSLNPVFTIGDQIAESIRYHQKHSKKEAFEKAVEMLRHTGIPASEKRVHEYPHQISGGMRQRVMIAMALACQPKLLIADEPTTALDVTIQAQILDLILHLKEETGMGILFITHDLGVVAEICTRVIVMYLGQVVEEADVKSLFENPLHPYTKGLIKSLPLMDSDRGQKLHVIEGTVPSLHDVPKGCRFANRCPFSDRLCMEEMPELREHHLKQKVRCWHYDKVSEWEDKSYDSANF